MKAPDILKEASRILEERGKLRDSPDGERSMGRAISTFNALTDKDLTELDGWVFMIILKLSRAQSGKAHLDDYQDIAGYSALACECLHEQEVWEASLRETTRFDSLREAERTGDWVSWKGETMPVGYFVEVRLRCGEDLSGPCNTFNWSHSGSAFDIVAYRIVK